MKSSVKFGILFPTIIPNILARYIMTCILTTLSRQHTASHQYHQSCYHSNDSQSSKNTNKGRLGASLPPGHKMEAELTCPLNTWHEGWKKETHFSLPHICGILITTYSIAEMLVRYWVGKFLSTTPNQNNTNNIGVGICGAGQAMAWPLFELLYTLKQNRECGGWWGGHTHY